MALEVKIIGGDHLAITDGCFIETPLNAGKNEDSFPEPFSDERRKYLLFRNIGVVETMLECESELNVRCSSCGENYLLGKREWTEGLKKYNEESK